MSRDHAIRTMGIAIFVSVFLVSLRATAGPLEDAVDRIENKINNVVSNTDGVQDLVGNVRSVTSGFEPGLFDDLRDALGEAQDLLALVKARREEAGSSSDQPDLRVLIDAMLDIVRILLDDPGIEFGTVSQLLDLLPDQIVAIAGLAVSKAGIDDDRVAEIQQAAFDLALVRDALAQFDADQGVFASARGVQSTEIGTLLLPTRCFVFDEAGLAVSVSARLMRQVAWRFWIIGEALTLPKNFIDVSSTSVEVHGYVGVTVETDVAGTVGSVLKGASAVMLEYADVLLNRLDHCEIIRNQERALRKAEHIYAKLDGKVCVGPPVDVCDGDGVCEVDEDCRGCASDCMGVTSGPQADRWCCGDTMVSEPEGDGAICDGNY